MIPFFSPNYRRWFIGKACGLFWILCNLTGLKEVHFCMVIVFFLSSAACWDDVSPTLRLASCSWQGWLIEFRGGLKVVALVILSWNFILAFKTGYLSNRFPTSAVKIVYISWTPYLNSSAETSCAQQAGENSLRPGGEALSSFCEGGDSSQAAGSLLSLNTSRISALVPKTNPLLLLNSSCCTV